MLKNGTKKLTDDLINTFEPQSKGTVTIRDSHLSRFGVMVSKLHRTFFIQAERPFRFGPRRTYVIRLGKHPMVTVDEARAAAIKVLAAIDRGEEPSLPGQQGVAHGVTLASAWESYERGLAAKVSDGVRSPKTIHHFRDMYARLLKPLHGETLARLSAQPDLTRRLHECIAERNGKPSADAAMRMLRATYRHAARNDRSLSAGHHPCTSVEFSAKATAPDNALALEDLSDWYEQLRALGNPVRQEFYLFTLLSGLRVNDILTARFEHIDWKKRALFVGKPKGGVRRSFWMPLSRAMIRCLWRSRAAGRTLNPRHAPVFCFAGKSGGLGYNAYDLPATGHALRRTWRSAALAAGVSEEICSRLGLNHRSGTMTSHYLSDRAVMATYAAAQEQISTAIVAALVPDAAQRCGLT